MDKRLRLLLLSTALLLVPTIGQLIAVRDLNTSGRLSDLAFLFQLVGIFFVPTSIILTAAIFMVIRKRWREHERLAILCGLNALIAINLVWFAVHSCSWAQVFGMALKTCR
jgi:hypothetical protein